MIVPGGGISVDGTRWIACGPDFILTVKVLSCLFRGLFPVSFGLQCLNAD
jgi:hypothetical protein